MDTTTSDLIRFFVERGKKIDARFTTDYGEMHLSISPGKNKVSFLVDKLHGKNHSQIWGSISNDFHVFRLWDTTVSEEELSQKLDQLKAL